MAFFYKWTDEYIEGLDVSTFGAYYTSTYVIEKVNVQNAISANLIPMLKPSSVKKKISEIKRDISGFFERELSSVNTKYLAEQAARKELNG